MILKADLITLKLHAIKTGLAMQNKQKILASSLQPRIFTSFLTFGLLLIFSVPNFPQQKDVLLGFPPFDNLQSNRQVDFTEIAEDSNLTYLGTFGWGPCFAVAYKENYTFVGNGNLIQVVDIIDPSNPIFVTEIDNEHTIYDLKVVGDYLFALSPLRVLDISYPQNPVTLFYGDYGGYEIITDSNYVYISNYNEIYILNISTPSQPILMSTFYIPGWSEGMDVYGDYLYTTTGDVLYIEIIDISDKSNPFGAGAFGFGTLDLTIEDHYLYATPFDVYDLSDPISPELLSSLFFTDEIPIEIILNDTLAYVSMGKDGISIIDVSDKSNPERIKDYAWFGYPSSSLGPNNIVINDDKILAASTEGMWINQIISADSLESLSFYHTGTFNYDIIADENYGYIASSSSGLIIFNHTDPYKPFFVSQVDTWGAALRLELSGNILILLTITDLLFIDITDQYNPMVLSSVPGEYYFSLALNNSIVVCGNNGNHIRIIDYTNVYNPIIQKEFTISSLPAEVAIYGDYLYSAEGSAGIRIYDLSPPIPILINTISGENGLGVLVNDKILYAARGGELSMYNLNVPSDPLLLSSLPTPGSRSFKVNLDYDKNQIYMSYNDHLEVIDVSMPDLPYISAFLRDYPAGFWGIKSKNGYLFVTTGRPEVRIYKNDLILTNLEDEIIIENPDGFVLNNNFPNPFNSMTKMEFRIQSKQYVTLIVYDVLGKKVSTLVNEEKSAGEYSINFNASNLPSGIYFYRMTSGKFTTTKKLILLK